MKRKQDPSQEGHTREWADRARVEMDPREDVKRDASPKQSPDDNEDVEEKSSHLHDDDDDATFY
jgi:hypothetical protein